MLAVLLTELPDRRKTYEPGRTQDNPDWTRSRLSLNMVELEVSSSLNATLIITCQISINVSYSSIFRCVSQKFCS